MKNLLEPAVVRYLGVCGPSPQMFGVFEVASKGHEDEVGRRVRNAYCVTYKRGIREGIMSVVEVEGYGMTLFDQLRMFIRSVDAHQLEFPMFDGGKRCMLISITKWEGQHGRYSKSLFPEFIREINERSYEPKNVG